ncbi:imelysin family protein [Taylorella asinigenitalis]|uniref:imelysin family protein n=1 Tax=Taylorella asinigenitalis TaxID=84590 RepID=UPI0004907C2F|nr:imelysin family protein [Taylorella asinigenitalis]
MSLKFNKIFSSLVVGLSMATASTYVLADDHKHDHKHEHKHKHKHKHKHEHKHDHDKEHKKFDHVHIDEQAALENYANIALKYYSDSLKDAKTHQQALKKFTANPTEETLKAAKDTWLKARESYGLTEALRLSNGPIDAEEGWVAETYGNLESQINAWPLDEFMIDYTIDAKGNRTSGNIIDSTGKFKPTGDDAKEVDITKITPEVLTELNENGGEANVATGWHAIEFLLWGQDQDYNSIVEDKITSGPLTAGQRPLTDYTEDKFKERRKDYLNATAEKLVSDLQTLVDAWSTERDGAKGLYRQALLGQLKGDEASKNIKTDEAIKQILSGLGVFIKSELANERIAVAVLTPSEEDEHSCFADNTHRDIDQNFRGWLDLLKGQTNGKSSGVSFYDSLGKENKAKIDKLIADIQKRISVMNEVAVKEMHFDYQILPQNEVHNKNLVSMKNQMRRLGDQMIVVAKSLHIDLTEADVTDAEETKVN